MAKPDPRKENPFGSFWTALLPVLLLGSFLLFPRVSSNPRLAEAFGGATGSLLLLFFALRPPFGLLPQAAA